MQERTRVIRRRSHDGDQPGAAPEGQNGPLAPPPGKASGEAAPPEASAADATAAANDTTRAPAAAAPAGVDDSLALAPDLPPDDPSALDLPPDLPPDDPSWHVLDRTGTPARDAGRSAAAEDDHLRRSHVDILAPEPEPRTGTRPGDRAVRLRRPHVEGVRRLEAGVYEIVSSPEATGGVSRFLRRFKQVMLGAPIRSEHEAHERLSKLLALAAFGTDNISSSAYATEEMMRVLILAGGAALIFTMPISLSLMALLAIVVISYQQTIRAYPQGGGSYIVTSRNLGTIPGLVAGASILVDYVLTVAVSTSAGIAALTSAYPALYHNRVLLAVIAVSVIAWGNLRGIRESGTLFALPLYAYLVCWFAVLAFGLYQYLSHATLVYVPPPQTGEHLPGGAEVIGLFLILRAFASGAVGLTGTEAIADGVGAFKEPSDRNARIVLVVMASCFAIIFLGISFLSSWIGIIPDPAEVETVNSQLTRTLIGTGWPYQVVQFTTFLLLVLAANTAFADFPRLAYFLARDRFLPSQFKERGVRLAFNNGILALAVIAAILIVIFQGSVTNLIPLYTIGVFVAFTLSQSSLVLRWWRTREPGWHWRLAVNLTGAVVTFVVAIVVAVTKFALGAWVVLVLIPMLVLLLLSIRRHFQKVADQLAVDVNDRSEHPDRLAPTYHHYVLIPVADLNRAALQAIAYARSLTGARATDRDVDLLDSNPDGRRAVIQAVHVTDDVDAAEALQAKWEKYDPGIELVIIESPYRAFIGPLMRYIDAVERRHPEGTARVTVLLPEYIPARWWEYFLHTHTALQLKGALLFRRRTAVASVPYHLAT